MKKIEMFNKQYEMLEPPKHLAVYDMVMVMVRIDGEPHMIPCPRKYSILDVDIDEKI